MGIDPVAVDATGARLMGIVPERIPTLVFAAAKRLGRLAEAEIPQLGEPISALAQQFVMPPLVERELLPMPGANQRTG
jgi:branched-subunit amino acid ABC-type transport system permease component